MATTKSGAKKKPGRPGAKKVTHAPVVRKAGVRDWIAGARLRTLPLAIAPVALGSGAAHIIGPEVWHQYRMALCLLVAVAIQIAVNYANDYSDGVRGTDKHRVGPSRLTGSGAAKPRTVLIVSLAFFAIAALAGIALIIVSHHWWLFAVGAACIAAAWFYTGGRRPYGYFGLGELFVFVFFGLVATAGTTYVQVGHVSFESWLAGVSIGFIACAVLMVNNLRDREQDKLAGKRTLSVLIGDRASRIVYVIFIALPYVALIYYWLLFDNAIYVFFTLLIAIPAAAITLTAKTAKELILVLQLTSLLALLFGLGLAWAIAF